MYGLGLLHKWCGKSSELTHASGSYPCLNVSFKITSTISFEYPVVVPNLIGLNRLEANIVLKSTSLNIGSEIFKSSVVDSLKAIIYKQYPIGDEENMLNIGSEIDLYFQNPDLENSK